MNPLEILALTLGVGWASGLNLYAAVLTLGLLGASGAVELPPGLEALTHPAVISIAGLLYCVEFFVDKTPGLDSVWDAFHSFIRIPAGAVLAALAIGPVDPVWLAGAGLLGASLATVSHTAKASSRMLINTSPEPFSNWGASLLEDLAVISGIWAALNHPVLFIIALIFLCILSIFLIRFSARMLQSFIACIKGYFCRPGEVRSTVLALPAPDSANS